MFEPKWGGFRAFVGSGNDDLVRSRGWLMPEFSRLRDVVVVWAVWVALTLIVVVVSGAVRLVPLHPHMRSLRARNHSPLWLLEGWDYQWYSRIADQGYGHGGAPSYAFFPLWPALLRAIAHIGPQAPIAVVAAASISCAAFIGVALTYASRVSMRPALALAAMPGSFALLLPYADGLALALGTLAFTAAKRSNWILASSLAFLAATARPNAFLLALLLIGPARRSRSRWRWIAVAAPIAGFLLVSCGFWLLSKNPFAFFHAEQHWGRGSPAALFRPPNDAWAAVQLAAAAAALILLWLLWKSRRRYGTPSFLFALSVVAVSLLSGTFAAFSRQMLFAFPLVWVAADIRAPHARIAACAGIAANIANILFLPHVFP